MPTKVAFAVDAPLKRFESAASVGTVPPAYSAKAEQPPAYPPAYSYAPASHSIGGKTLTAPLVQVQDLKAHLCLLRAFKNLRTAVEADPGTGSQTSHWPELAKKLDGPRRWTWFLGLTVDRFQEWLRSVKPSADVPTWVQEELPPIDVLMVWHAYLLNPMWYAEDCDRLKVLAPLKSMDPDILVKAIVSIGDISTHEPSAARIDAWEKQTATYFDPLYAASHASTRDIDCPRCLKSFSVPYLKADGKGYSQANFAAKCPSCGCGNVSKETLALLKFARDAALDPNDVDDLEEYGLGCFQAGTLRTMLNPHDTTVASAVKEQLREALAPVGALKSITNREDFVKHIVDNSKFSLTLAASRAGPSLKRSRPRRVMSAYTDDRPFSIDLVGAVSRQCSFIDKMHHFGWAEPGCFDDEEDEAVLVHSISRYHAFLDLLSSAPTSFFVPTLDIDLAWHTHQMFGTPYHTACLTYVQRFIDHDDQVEENYLSNAFDITCRAWQSRFGIPYSYCGCPLPGVTIGQRLSRLKLKLTIHKASCSELVPPQRPDALSATHASEHNAVFTTGHRSLSAAARKRRELKVRERRERDEKAAREGKMDAQSVKRGAEHDAAFLYPVPFYVPVAGCVAVGMSGGEAASGEPLFSCSSGRISCMAGGCCNGVGGCGSGGCGGGCGGGGCGGGGCGGGGN